MLEDFGFANPANSVQAHFKLNRNFCVVVCVCHCALSKCKNKTVESCLNAKKYAFFCFVFCLQTPLLRTHPALVNAPSRNQSRLHMLTWYCRDVFSTTYCVFGVCVCSSKCWSLVCTLCVRHYGILYHSMPFGKQTQSQPNPTHT